MKHEFGTCRELYTLHVVLWGVARVEQAELEFPESRRWGGKRKGAGRRKRKRGVAHGLRAAVSRHDPRLVTMKLARGLPRLRNMIAGREIVECIRAGQKASFRIVHYSIQTDHLHLIVEADDRVALTRGMKGLAVRVARALNKLWNRRGKVFPECFHERVLRSLRQVRNALRYVLNNHLKHAAAAERKRLASQPDRFSSGRYFDGWLGRAPDLEPGLPGAIVAVPGWKIRSGWKQHYRPIALNAVPSVVT